MSAKNHPEYKEEVSRLDYTMEFLENYNSRIINEKLKIDREVEYSVQHYNSDNAEQFNELLINSTLQDSLSQKLKNLDKSLSKPYFARVDFIEDGQENLQKLYIGKISLMRDKDNELVIIDWRAPISTLYYEGRLGEASFDSPEGNVKGEIKLKRQYTMEKAELEEIYDIDITTNDEFLQAALGSSKDKRLKDIVSTIQSEQNQVIRADMWKSLVVQGAAGGGKTTIALHRIAYLLYNYEKTLSPKNFMIIAPNRYFLSYISEVLPDLGVENVLQTTFEDFAMNIIGKKYSQKNNYEKLAYLVSYKITAEESNLIKKATSFKSSLEFKEIIDNYLETLETKFIPEEDFKIHSFVLMKYEDINNFFLKEYNNLPFISRVTEIKKSLVNIHKQRKKPILEEIEADYDRKINEVRDEMEDSPERRDKIIFLAEERDSLIKKVKRLTQTAIKDYLKKIKVLSPMDYYIEFLENKKLFLNVGKNYIDEATLEVVRCGTLENLRKNKLEIEDLAPLMYIKYCIAGLEEKLSVRHVVIDEAQDFSEFQLFILKKLIGGNSFTILGDLCQGIYSYRGINDWEDVSNKIFGKENYNMLTLEQSYRTTIEIMEAANKVIGFLKDSNLPSAKPVLRHGDEVEIIEKNDIKEISYAIAKKIEEIKKEGFKSAAIICKTLEECEIVKINLKKLGLNLNIIKGTESEFIGGIVLIPSYLVKGLEFDVVIIANASQKAYSEDPLDVKLLYIAMTRPLHRLYIFSEGERAAMLCESKR